MRLLKGLVVFGVIGLSALGFRVLRRRNTVALIDPQSLVTLPDDETESRVVHLEGAVNFREVGGYPTSTGGRTRRGLVYRAGSLARLTEADLERLHNLNLRLVCDLRGADEVSDEPDRLPQNPAPLRVHLPLVAEDDRLERLWMLFFDRRRLPDFMREMYTRIILEQNARLYGSILERLSHPENLPALIHCTAGKDRTGIAIALLLSVLGVPEETILADYSLSNQHYDTFFRYGSRAMRAVERFGLSADDLQPFLLANPATLKAALDDIRAKYGSLEAYLIQAAGLDAAVLSRLRSLLVDDQPS
jgi:protein-tyrosine phosphatase